jgi:HEAT repeats
MNRDRFTELAYLYLLNEIDESGKIELEDTLMQDDLLKEEFEQIKQTVFLLKEKKPSLPDERLLVSARRSLMREIRKEAGLPSPFVRAANSTRKFLFENYRFAFGGVMTFALGIVIGYLFFASHPWQQTRPAQVRADYFVPAAKDTLKRDLFIPGDEGPGNISKEEEVKILFSGIKPVKSTVAESDPFIQQLLIASMLSGANPGVRLKSLNKILQQLKGETVTTDPTIKKALITALKTDKNPAVRREALGALTKYQIDNEIRDALLFTLSNDSNSGMRVAAINALADLKQNRKILDEAVKDVLTKKAATDNNNFIRLRAASLLQEVN